MLTTWNRAALAVAHSIILVSAAAGCNDDGNDRLTDPKVLGVLVTANEGEAQFSQAGLAKATNPEVESFANMMVEQHTDALAQVRQVATETSLGTPESPTSRRLERQVETETTALNGRDPGKEYDLRFMCAQIRLHSDVLDTIDDTLEPSATNTRVRELVNTTRPVVAQHLQEARGIVQRVNASTIGTDAGTGNADAGTDEDVDDEDDAGVDAGHQHDAGGGPATPEDICRSRGGS
jgi:putative membrane protein